MYSDSVSEAGSLILWALWEEGSPRQLVLALGAGLQEFEAPPDGEVDSLVVAQFEMQVAPMRSAPVAAEERAVLEEEERLRRGGSARLRARTSRVRSFMVLKTSSKKALLR